MFEPLTRSCRGFDNDPVFAAAYAEHSFALRTACKPAALEALDNMVRSSRAAQPRCAPYALERMPYRWMQCSGWT
jgi:hypothetical protein